MIKSFIAVTREIDDPKTAAEEIIKIINPQKNLLKNSIGIVSCFSEFEESGALSEICASLPFETIGATTCLCSTGGETDQVIFAVTVLTSDDCDFKTVKIPLTDAYDKSVASVLTPFLNEREEKPALILSYFPLMNTVSGDMIIESIDNVTGNIPLFGTAAVDHSADYSTAKTIYNGEAFRESVVLGVVYGNPTVTYKIAALDERKIRSQKAIITGSDGNILTGVNGKSALEYLEEIGLSEDIISAGLGILPFVINRRDGTGSVVRAVFTLTPDGNAVCAGSMPVGAALGIASINTEDIINTSRSVFTPLIQDDAVILGYSCIGRYHVMGANSTVEAEKISEIAGESNYMFSYSGGEVCPLPNAEGELKNFFHNYSAAFCRLS